MAAEGGYQPTSDELSLERGIAVARDCARHCTTRESKAMALRLAADLAARCSPELWARIKGRVA